MSTAKSVSFLLALLFFGVLPPTHAALSNTTLFTEIGTGAASKERIFSSKRTWRLDYALLKLIPNGWVLQNGSEHQDFSAVQVSWKSAGSWVRVLSQISIENQIPMLVNWDSKTLTLGHIQPPSPPTNESVALNSEQEIKTDSSINKKNPSGEKKDSPGLKNQEPPKPKRFLPAGEVEQIIKNLVENHGYNFKAYNSTGKVLTLDFPLKLSGDTLLSDIKDIREALNGNPRSKYYFDLQIFDLNSVVVLEIQRK